MQPTLGRIVHYKTHLGITCAAIIAWVNDNNTINLAMITPTGSTEGRSGVRQGDEAGQWSWPPCN